MKYSSFVVALTASAITANAGAQQPIILRGNSLGVAGLAISPSTRRIATAGLDGTLRTWTMPDANNTVLLKDLGEAYAVAISPDAKRIAVTSWQHPVYVTQTRAGAERLSLPVGDNWCGAVAWSPDGTRIAAGCSDSRLRIWNATTGRIEKEIPGAGGLNAVAWLTDGSSIVTSGGIWNVMTGQRLRTMTGHTASIRTIVVSKDGQRIATASLDKTVRVWNASTGANLLTLSPDGLAIHTDTGWVKPSMRLPQLGAAFSPDGKNIATGGSDRLVRLWDSATGKELGDFYGHTMTVTAVAFLDDTHIVSASLDGTVRIWDINKDMRRVNK